MVGKSRSGKFCTFIAEKDSMPARLAKTKNISAGTGLRMHQAETFIWPPP